jgi:hypothetical protein
VDISYKRRILHGKIDILRAELVNRLRKKHEGGEDVITGADVQKLTDILAGRRPATRRRGLSAPGGGPGRRSHGPALPRMRLHQRRGGQLLPEVRRVHRRDRARPRRGRRGTDRHVPRRRDGRLHPVEIDEVTGCDGAALVIRSGGGRVGESFPLDGQRMSIGRRPDSDVFLDDVTVSRDHALLVRRSGAWFLDDLGSLNGTYVNRRRIESHRLEDGDELQVGKYKLTFLQR